MIYEETVRSLNERHSFIYFKIRSYLTHELKVRYMECSPRSDQRPILSSTLFLRCLQEVHKQEVVKVLR